MKPFNELSNRGKGRRLLPLATSALKQYDLSVRRVRLVGVFTNTLYRAVAEDGAAYLVRVCAPGWRTTTDLLSEVAWLNDLALDPEIGAPQPILASDGAYLVEASAPGISEPCRVMLMTWLPGVMLTQRLTPANLEKMGKLFALLHLRSASFHPPQGFTCRRLEWIYSRGEEDVLFSPACEEAFTPSRREIYEQVAWRVRAAYTGLYADPQGLRVIHHDLHTGNIKVDHGRLHPLDFEDTAWGYPVQDIAMALHDLWVEVSQEDYDAFLAAFRRGYERLSPWPEAYPGQIDTFRAGRMLWVSNYVARFERSYLAGFIERVSARFAGFLQTGQIRKG